MNYLIWNDKNSNDISGLIICELPPITKPKIRTSTTEIDGRDGDIVEYLGYKSYNKSVKIGLSRKYDIDEIIKYFTGKGKIVFSNEPDKYYNSQIVDSIDYEKLIKFKEATIKFYTQPYKYKLNEESTSLEITTETELIVTNNGLETSKPKITLYGSGDVVISINGLEAFTINIDDEYVVIDSENEEAYKESVLKNRLMDGEFPTFNSGSNTITWSGSLTKIIVEPNSRWL